MAHYHAGETVQFTAQRNCALGGRAFRAGDIVSVVLDDDWDDRDGIAEGGPWGYGGYTHYALRHIAERIIDAQTGRVLLSWPPKSARPGYQPEYPFLDE